ncbi:MAG: hypothetical protein SH809_01530 [Rhodothermales bacterium]|nr:hypothetical protein [Rhodothermales bacterium]
MPGSSGSTITEYDQAVADFQTRLRTDGRTSNGNWIGALQFRNPNGVAYFDRVVYVADTGNNRISRFKLNTDFE